MSTDWPAFFATHHHDLAAFRWKEVADALHRERAGSDLAPLKRYVRQRHDAAAAPDPWRVEAVLRAAGLAQLCRLPTAILDAPIPAHGLHEPALDLRAFVLARRILALLFDGSVTVDADPKELPGLAGVAGAELVFWYLTGAPEPGRPNPAELRDLVDAATGVDEILAPLGLLSAASRDQRRARIAAIARQAERAGAGQPVDEIHRELIAALEERRPYLRLAREAAVAAIRKGDVRPADRAVELVTRMLREPPPASRASALASFCVRAQAFGIVAALGIDDVRFAAYSVQIVEQLVAALPPLVASPPLSLLDATAGLALWRAVAILARERADAGAAAHLGTLLDAAAETASWTPAVARQLARVTGVIGSAPGLGEKASADLPARLVMRLAATTARLRGDKLWSNGIKQYVAAAGDDPAAELLRRWWAPVLAPGERLAAPPAELVRVTELLAGRELTSREGVGRVEACRAWWARPDVPRPKNAGKGPAVARIGESLQEVSALPPWRPDARGRAALGVQRLEGKHGEQYVLIKLFGVSGRDVTVLAEDDVYARPVDRTQKLDQLHATLRRLRDAAREGRAGPSHVAHVREGIAALATRELWEDVAEHVTAEAPEIQLSVHDFGVPWELAPIAREGGAATPLSLLAPTFRRRGRKPRPPAEPAEPCRSLLLLCDRTQPGVDAEIAVIERAWSAAPGRTIHVVERVSAFRALSTRERFDVVHYAGHQGPAHDSTPALFLGDERLPIQDLMDRLRDHPPRLVFLDACSTLGSTETLAVAPGKIATHMVFGLLEPLSRSKVASIVGTLWDVTPPPDHTLTRVFYEAVGAGNGFVDAMHAARLAAARDDRWAACWPAYVILAP